MRRHAKAGRTSDGMYLTLTDAKGRELRTALLRPGDVDIVWRMVERLEAATGSTAKVVMCEGGAVPWEVVGKEQLRKGGAALSVRAKRKRAGMSQAELADALGVKQATVSEIEAGKRAVGKRIAEKLARIFSVDYRSFL